ncbi:hypothetical protein CVT24_003400 [Panaeolus cyanescens]|uniref:Autophagy-related protein 9 n=1 Tax=Panaeolus cyanescens TaxID=181874 RepID=A0A409Y743_9AGAR|nr:hypothetical protein CVT24_003400 [Panaeolus cyanescens]
MSRNSTSRSKRPSTGASFLQDSSLGGSARPSSSRPFLNMINPMNSTYHAYSPANQSLLEEEGESTHEEIDLESGPSTIFQSMHEARPTATTPTPTSPSPKAQGKRRMTRDSNSPGMPMRSSVLRPNIHKEDKMHETSDDEDPQNFMIEPTAQRGTSPALGDSPRIHENQRLHSLNASDGRKLPPGSPRKVHKPLSASPRSSKPSDLYDEDNVHVTDFQTLPTHSRGTSTRQKPVMRGLDEYEKALWNWVNVYNLDAFLQEVYQYYEGKGVYSIALSRGLNLLTVGFVIGFSTFLLGCIDYPALRRNEHTRLSDVIVERCVSK